MNSRLQFYVVYFLGVLCFFILGSFWYFRIDLTEEKRFSLHPATEVVLDSLTSDIHIEVLLTGDQLPSGFRRLQRAIEQTIRTMDSYTRHRITFSYLDPLGLSAADQEEFILDLKDYGINPTNILVNQTSGQQTRLVFPGILVSNEEYEAGALVLKGEKGMSSEQILNQSIENLEFEISNAIRKLSNPRSGAIAMLIGHGEMAEDDGFGLVEALDADFELYKVPLEQARTVSDLVNFEIIVIQGPRQAYTERELFLLDQYVLQGGNLLVLLDGVSVAMQQAEGEGTLAMPLKHGLENLLFRYGIRVNTDLIQDLNYGYFPVMGGNFGNQEQLVPLPWPFYVQASQMQDHPITKGLDVIYFRFLSSLDTVLAPGVKKTPLVFSSAYSRVIQAPVPVSFRAMEQEPDMRLFNQANLPLVYLLEGQFTSAFKNRFIPEEFAQSAFKEEGSGKVLVIGDGSVFQSQSDFQTGSPLNLGEDPFNQLIFANRIFLRNLAQYLQNPAGIIASRTKSFQIRPLNRIKVSQEKRFWQIFTVGLPIVLLLVVGFSFTRWRKWRFTSNFKK